MKILLTGATGFLGSRLLRDLLAAGHRVVCAGRRPPAVDDARCVWRLPEFWLHPHGPMLKNLPMLALLLLLWRLEPAPSPE